MIHSKRKDKTLITLKFLEEEIILENPG